MSPTQTRPWTQTPVQVLIAVTFVSSATVWAAVPYLPIFLSEEVGYFPVELIGVAVAASALGLFVGQYPMARLARRVSIRSFIVAGFVVEGVSMLGVVAVSKGGGAAGVAAIVGLRFVAGIARAGIAQSVRAAIRKVSASEQRAEVFGLVGSADIAGITLGTFLAGLVAFGSVRSVFVAGALACAVCIPLALALPRQAPAEMTEPDGDAEANHTTLFSVRVPLTVLLLFTAATTVLIGAYNSAWGPYLRDRGAGEGAVGMLFALFTIPFIAFAPLFGRWARTPQRRMTAVVVGTALAVVAAISYPFLAWLPVVVVVELLAASGSAAAEPSLDALVSDLAQDEDAQSKIFGIAGTASSAVSAGSAVVAGLLMTGGVGRPFLVMGCVAALALALGSCLLGLSSRSTVAGGEEAPAEPASHDDPRRELDVARLGALAGEDPTSPALREEAP
ncbi:MFS transporter [Phycicoccus flavus]|uniref:MFS transporter n=1 Tax=Phycicoccus flavus TaxID=2502783 RepID=A0A8T6R9Y9_9MICO|nr:MFS transporter [Phycicoccus flavus]NHA69041.1 MFS transporter [Phycicoccus flavus]